MKIANGNAGMTRIVTAVIGIACVVPIVIMGGTWFNSVVVLLAFAGLRELVVAARRSSSPIMPEAAYPALAWVLAWLWRSADAHVWRGDADALRALLLITASLFFVPVGLMIRALWRFNSAKPASIASVGLTYLAVNYCGLFTFLILLRALPTHGANLFWMLLLGVWVGDTLAYFGGKKFGKHKLTTLSPGKTREGAIIGAVTSFAVAFAIAIISSWQIGDAVVLAAIIALFAPVGDLAESLWKREFEVKDMGATLPGHGGVLDRCDSLLFTALPVYFYAVLRIIA